MKNQEFEILRVICENPNINSTFEISNITGEAQETVSDVIRSLTYSSLIDSNYQITQEGYSYLEAFRVKNAIILAAGMCTRFIPVSYELPKGLISVKGEVLIERQIRQLQEAGIQEIIVVVGYMMEKFFYLRDKYNVKLVVNNEFSTKNTHSSIYFARDYLSSTYILCSDNYYPNNMFHQYEYRPYYCSIYLPGTSYVERAFSFDEEGLIYDTNKPSQDQWIMYGHAYFNQEFTDAFRPVLEDYYGKPGVEGMYWENVWAENVKDIPLWIKKCDSSEILEFDSMDELKAFDPDYIFNNKVKVFENICQVLSCHITDISELVPIKKGLNNQSFKFCVNGHYYIYRHPGLNASAFIDRNKEAKSLLVAKELQIDETLVYIDEDEGWKISDYISTSKQFDFGNIEHIHLLSNKLKMLHDANVSVGFGFNYMKEADEVINLLRRIDAMAYRRCLFEREQMMPLVSYLQNDQWQISLCHNDIYEPNLLLKGNELNIIDWEFAGDSDIGFDICKLFAVHNPPFEEIDYWLNEYYGRDTSNKEKLHLIACAAIIYFYWYVWGIFAEKNNSDVSNYMIEWYDKMNSFRDKANQMIEIEGD